MLSSLSSLASLSILSILYTEQKAWSHPLACNLVCRRYSCFVSAISHVCNRCGFHPLESFHRLLFDVFPTEKILSGSQCVFIFVGVCHIVVVVHAYGDNVKPQPIQFVLENEELVMF